MQGEAPLIATTKGFVDEEMREWIQRDHINPIFSRNVEGVKLDKSRLADEQEETTANASSECALKLHSELMIQPQSLSRRSFQNDIIRERYRYYVSQKNDGVRVWILFTRDKETNTDLTFAFNRAGNIWLLPSMTAAKSQGKEEEENSSSPQSNVIWQGTLVDGELVTVAEYNPEVENSVSYQYVILDVIYFSGMEHVQACNFSTRLQAAQCVAEKVRWDGVTVRCKQWTKLDRYFGVFRTWTDFLAHHERSVQFEMGGTDGLIFMHEFCPPIKYALRNVPFSANPGGSDNAFRLLTSNRPMPNDSRSVFKFKQIQTLDFVVLCFTDSTLPIETPGLRISDCKNMRILCQEQWDWVDVDSSGCGCGWSSTLLTQLPTKRAGKRGNNTIIPTGGTSSGWFLANMWTHHHEKEGEEITSIDFGSAEEEASANNYMLQWLEARLPPMDSRKLWHDDEYKGFWAVVEFTVVSTGAPTTPLSSSSSNSTVATNTSHPAAPQSSKQCVQIRPIKIRTDKDYANSSSTICKTLATVTEDALSLETMFGLFHQQRRGRPLW